MLDNVYFKFPSFSEFWSSKSHFVKKAEPLYGWRLDILFLPCCQLHFLITNPPFFIRKNKDKNRQKQPLNIFHCPEKALL